MNLLTYPPEVPRSDETACKTCLPRLSHIRISIIKNSILSNTTVDCRRRDSNGLNRRLCSTRISQIMESQDDNPVRSVKAWIHSLELGRIAVSALISGGIRPGMEENPFEYVRGDVFGD